MHAIYQKLDLRLNSFETKADGFCKRAADVVVFQFYFSLQENQVTVKLANE